MNNIKIRHQEKNDTEKEETEVSYETVIIEATNSLDFEDDLSGIFVPDIIVRVQLEVFTWEFL